MTTPVANPTARATAKHVRVTPMKARRVVDLVRGKRVEDALAILKFAPQAASEPVAKVVASAAAQIIRTTTKVKAHDENEIAGIGDRVQLMETRPLSATKHWRLVEILEKAK